LPSQVSGGQQQRAAIARALANDPQLIVADEPTGNLDEATADAVFELFLTLNQQGKTLVMVTHNESLAESASRRIVIHSGRIVEDQLSDYVVE
jgi:putative ABC transport system ATP-binding protein